MAALTWIGDSDPEAQSITLYGQTFVKGEPVNVTDKKVLEKLDGHPMFAKGKAEVVAADEPSEEEQAARAEEGTVKAALKAQLAQHGIVMKGNPSEDTLRNKLVEATR